MVPLCVERLSTLTMPSQSIAPFAKSSTPARAGASAASQARFWDRIAVKYAADPIADRIGYEATLRRIQNLLSADQDVLEIGCGTGTTALRLAPFTRRLFATDVSAGMIAIARKKLAAEPVSPLSFDVADADAALASRTEVDVVLALNLFHLMTDLDRGLELAARALRPGGLLISKTACIAEMNPLIQYLALPLMQAIGKAPPALCFDAAELQSAIARQGLDIVSVERHGSRGKDFRVFILARKPA